MKKTVFSALVLFVVFMTAGTAIAQQEWQWGKRGQFPVKDIAVDNNGNTYVLWPVSEQANVDGHPIPGRGNTDMAVSSFSCNGTYRWTKVIGSTAPDAGLAIGTDSLGGLYILGNNGSSNSAVTYIDDDTVVSPTLKKIMLIKYDTSGNFKWLRMPEPQLSSVTNSGAFNLSVEPDGHTHIMALLEPGTYGGTFSAAFSSDKNIYALKYDKNGAFTGGLHFDITRSSSGISTYGFGLIYDPVSSHYYYGGTRLMPNEISFGSTSIPGNNFLACFSNTGNTLWVQKSNNNAIPTGFTGKPAVDNAGNVYVTGYSYNDFNGGAGDGFGSYNFNNSMGTYGFPVVVKFNATGAVQYATNASVNTDNAGKAVACVNGVLGAACEYGGGNFEWDSHSLSPNNQYVNNFLVRFNAANGTVMAIDTLNSGPGVNEYASVLTADRTGNFYMGGEFQGTLIVDGVTLVKQDGSSDGYIAKFGQGNCNCSGPVAAFSANATALHVTFTYTGATAQIDSVTWSFGDGQSASGLATSHTYAAAGTYNACATAFSNCGTSQHCQNITVTGGGTAIGSGAAFPKVLIYPNPAQNRLYLEGVPAGCRYELYNALGVRVQAGSLAAQPVIPMDKLPSGWYNLVLQDEAGRKAQWKIIRQ